MYKLRKPVEAVQYEFAAFEACSALVKSVHPEASIMGQHGYFRAYNDGGNYSIASGQWLVKIGSSLAVLDDDQFREQFEPAG
ncbi:hypothetical protein Q2K19_10595 [Micromonospora soli]|uniref:hypothetical protein n=1 Tax=Micromonospora sp. NBRC 110009 TaxID=3061627 RepID=UPI002672ED82|nr:hypothetical protein [Micromonospora sp. NBRC 110009]WKU00886.1 hypothetical protein Q2K19_10595 [Micromonospora sp. NBRC 110009]